MIAGSKSLIEFSTSGLENPLSHLLLVGCLAWLWRTGNPQSALPVASFIGGLAVLSRLDLVVLIGPPLAAAAWQARRGGYPLLVRSVLLAAGPLVLWWAFAFVYYGSIWPNTALAKLPSNVGLSERLPQGLRYLVDAAVVDPLTVVVITSATVWAWWRDEARAAAVGLTASLCYVVAVGGDFMTGRFLSAPAIVAVAFLVRSARWTGRGAAVVAAASVALGLAMPQSPLRVWQQPQVGDAIVSHGAGIVDERAVYAPYTSVIAAAGGTRPSDHPWARGGRAMAVAAQVVTFEAVGLLGYHAGPGIHIVDPMALTDPWLARLPADRPWRVGHLRRTIPVGYVDFLRACVANAFPGHAIAPPSRTCLDPDMQPSTAMDPPTAEAYTRIATLTQLPLTDARRLAQLRRGGL
jgi:arabinofuranosyltransferase